MVAFVVGLDLSTAVSDSRLVIQSITNRLPRVESAAFLLPPADSVTGGHSDIVVRVCAAGGTGEWLLGLSALR
jgi:hypothetical protein